MSEYDNALFALVNAAALVRPLPAGKDKTTNYNIVSDDDSQSSCSTDDAPLNTQARDDGTSGTNDHNEASARKRSHALPVILMSILMDESNHDTISFVPDGSAFVVIRPQAFAPLMKKHFHCVKFSTFVKKMAKWGFHFDKNLKDEVIFRHPSFRKGDWDRCRRIRRTIYRIQDTTTFGSHRASTSPTSHMDLNRSADYSLPIPVAPRSPSPLAQNIQKSNFSSLVPSQIEVDRATEAVIGAAMEVLARDNCHPHIPQNYLNPMSFSGLSSRMPRFHRQDHLQQLEAELASVNKLEAELVWQERQLMASLAQCRGFSR